MLDKCTCYEACFVSFSDNFFQFRAPTFVNSSSVHLAIFEEKWRQQKQKSESSETEYSIQRSTQLVFLFFTLITNNLALTYSLKYDNANKMRQCENIFVFIDLTKSIGSDLGGAVNF